jgi:glycosyltransferase involved in cell wall biosynthesis
MNMPENTVSDTPDRIGAAPEFSILVTCHFEERSIEEFHARLSGALESLGRSYEIIMVNDGSTDGTWERMKSIFAKDSHVRVVMDFFRNAGQQAAITACMCEARGRAFILMDSDLQLMPEELPLLVAEYDAGNDLVSGYRRNRRDSFWRIIPSKLANVIMRRASKSTMRDFGCTFKIYNAAIFRAFNLGPTRIFSNVDATARLQRWTEVPVTHQSRRYGKSGWTFRKLWQYNMTNLISMSQQPFQVIAGLCLAASMLFLLRIGAGFFVDFRVLDAVTNGLLLNAIMFALLMQLAVLALVGEFAIRCFVMLQGHPAYIVREALRRDGPDADPAG